MHVETEYNLKKASHPDAQNDQRICCSLIRLFTAFCFYIWNFKALASPFGLSRALSKILKWCFLATGLN